MSINFNEHVLGVGPQGQLPPHVFDQMEIPDANERAAMQAVLDDYQAGQDATDTAVASVLSTGDQAPLALAQRVNTRLPGQYRNPLALPTYDGDPQVAHPDVLFIPEGFGPQAHRYWMAYTPYPGDLRENPSIASSPDGITWTVPPGAPSPVVPLAEIQAAGFVFNSDTDLIRLPDGRLAMYYRPINNNTGAFRVAVQRKTSTDGVTWSAAQTIADEPYTASDNAYRSPALVVEGNGNVTMWNVATIGGVNTLTRRTSTDDGATFGTATSCTVPTAPTDLWHVDVVRAEGRYWALINRRGKWDLQLAVSDDGLTFTHVRLIPKTGRSIDGYGHYRSTLVPAPGPTGLAFDIWANVVASGGVGPQDPPHDTPWRIALFRGIPATTDGTSDVQSAAVGSGAKVDGTVRGTAVGVNATVTGEAGVGSGAAIGYAASAAREAVAIGGSASAADRSVAIGSGTSAAAFNVAVGSGVSAPNAQSTVIGRSAQGSGVSATAVGNGAKAGPQGTALGRNADATQTDAVAIGETVTAGAAAVAIGTDITTSGNGAVGIGRLASAAGQYAVALGRTTNASHQDSVALGNGAVTSATNQVMVGNRDIESTKNGGGLFLRSPNGTRYKVTVTDAGELTVTAAP